MSNPTIPAASPATEAKSFRVVWRDRDGNVARWTPWHGTTNAALDAANFREIRRPTWTDEYTREMQERPF